MMLFQKIFLFGIENTGKTSLSQVLREGKHDPNVFPTTSFDIKALFLTHFEDSIEFRVWDAPGQVNYRNLWGEGYKASNLMIYIIDPTNLERLGEMNKTLHSVIDEDETAGVPLIICFHKIDLPDARDGFLPAFKAINPSLIYGREVYTVCTSVKEKGTIKDLKELIANIVKKGRETC